MATEFKSIEEVEQFYRAKIDAYVKQNEQLKRKALDTNVSGGYVNTYLSRGINRNDFATPLAQSLIAEEMANEGYFALALQQINALCSSIEVDLYIDNPTPLEKVIVGKVKKVINDIGGLKLLYSKIIYPALRWGTGIAIPTLQFDNKGGLVFKSLNTVAMQNIQQFIFDEVETTKLKQITYLTYNKLTNTGNTNSEIVTIDMQENCAGFFAYNAIEGNPLGLPYLYMLYTHYKTYKRLTEGVYSAVNSYGNYPIGVKRTARESAYDNLEWELQATNKMQDIIDMAGGPYIDGEGELYAITPPDTSNMSQSMKDIFDIVMRTSSLGQITAGIDGGGSRNLMVSLDTLTQYICKKIIEDGYKSIADTMIKSYCDIQFRKEFRTKKVRYPQFKIIEHDVITQEVKKVDEQDTTQKKRSVKQSMLVTDEVVIDQDDATKSFTMIRKDLNDIEKRIILDATELDNALVDMKYSIADELNDSIKPLLKEAVEKAVNNKDFKPDMFERDELKKLIDDSINNIVSKAVEVETNMIDEAFKAGNSSTSEQLNVNKNQLVERIKNKYLKSQEIKNIKKQFYDDCVNYVRNYATNVSNGLGLTKAMRQEGLNQALANIDGLKGRDIEKLSEDIALKTFANVSEFETREVLKKVDNYVMVRSGILEGQCEHCNNLMGNVYYLNGDEYYDKDGNKLVLPDPKCKGMQYGKQCRCFGILTPASMIN